MRGAWCIHLLLTLAVLALGRIAHAQQADTTRRLQDSLAQVDVNATRINPLAGANLLQFAGTTKAETLKYQGVFTARPLSAWIEETTPVFVRSSGLNSAATFSMRGASAAQSLVLWNGLPINNSALGVADLSLIPSAFVGQALLAHGSSAALLGSGNVGGALMLDDATPDFGPRRLTGKAAITAGSFQTAVVTGMVRLTDSLDAYSVLVQGSTAANDYGYTNALGQDASMPNARQRAGQLMASYTTRRIPKTLLSLKTWLTHAGREIPPALFEAASEKQTTDQALRLMALARREVSPRLGVLVRAAFTRDWLEYRDPAASLTSVRNVNRFSAQQEWTYHAGRHAVLAQLPVQWSYLTNVTARGDTLPGIAQVAGALSYVFQHRALKANANIRYEKNGRWQGWMPGVGMLVYRPELPYALWASAQRTFRAPTLNELYYFPGGNLALEPEQGWALEAGARVRRNIVGKGWSGQLGGTVFSRNIRNWILWYGGAIFTPHNVARVWSRGVEAEGELHWLSRPWHITATGVLSRLRSTTEESIQPGDGSIGRQIPYVPRLVWRATGSLAWRSWAIRYQQGYNGTRFVTSDESQWLLPYATASATAEKSWRMNRCADLTLMLHAANLWNQRYESVVGRPMPGRYAQATVQVEWK